MPLQLYTKVLLNLCPRVKDIHQRYAFACHTCCIHTSYMTRRLHTWLASTLESGIVIHYRAWPTTVSCHQKVMMHLVHIKDSMLHFVGSKSQFQNKDSIGILYLLVNTETHCYEIILCIIKPLLDCLVSSPLCPSVINSHFVSSLKLSREFMLYLPPNRFHSELTFEFGTESGSTNQPFILQPLSSPEALTWQTLACTPQTSTGSFVIFALGPFLLGYLPAFPLATAL